MGKSKVNLPHQKITDFCRKNHIIRLSLFGSALREDFHLDSDLAKVHAGVD
jgi:predicted nucleotidyltransferase